MVEKTFELEDIRSNLLILYVLGIVNLIYLLLLYFLETFASDPSSTSSGSPDSLELLTPILAVVAVGNVLLVQKFFLPKILDAEDVNSAFPYMLISSVVIESIGIYGLLIGLLDVFVIQQELRWVIVAPFMIIAFAIQLYLVQNVFSRKLRDLVNTTYSQTSS